MHVTVVTPPDLLVTLDEAKVALGESGNDRNGLISTLLLAAQAELDGPSGWVGCTVAPQSLELRTDYFCDPLRLPYGPVVAIGSVTYLDDDGQTQTAAADTYSLVSDGRVALNDGESWPSTLVHPEAVRVAYTAGMDEGTEAGRVALMRAAITLHVRMTLDGDDPQTRRRMIETLVQPLRVWGPA